MDIYDMLKLWCPSQLSLVSGCRNSGARPPTFLTAHSTGVGCIFTLLLPCETFAPLGLRYHRALCLGRRDGRIRRISQASNIKKPTRFIGTSWKSEGTKGTIVPFNPSAFSATEHLSLPLSARMQNNKTFHCLPK